MEDDCCRVWRQFDGLWMRAHSVPLTAHAPARTHTDTHTQTHTKRQCTMFSLLLFPYRTISPNTSRHTTADTCDTQTHTHKRTRAHTRRHNTVTDNNVTQRVRLQCGHGVIKYKCRLLSVSPKQKEPFQNKSALCFRLFSPYAMGTVWFFVVVVFWVFLFWKLRKMGSFVFVWEPWHCRSKR
jgi:hypothetical protein